MTGLAGNEEYLVKVTATVAGCQDNREGKRRRGKEEEDSRTGRGEKEEEEECTVHSEERKVTTSCGGHQCADGSCIDKAVR